MTTPADTYNYDTFRPAPYVEGGCDGPAPGDDLAGYDVALPDGSAASLGEIVEGLTVIETGSTTCPLYCANVSPMRAVAERHPEVRFAVLYTREAHPGGRRGAHTDLADKLEAASGLASEAGEWRTVLVDRLGGDLHRTLAASPNSLVVLDETARVVQWMHDADAEALEQVLTAIPDGQSTAARTSFHPPSPRIAMRALMRGGPKAVWDFVLGLPVLIRYRLAGGADC